MLEMIAGASIALLGVLFGASIRSVTPSKKKDDQSNGTAA